ncbi:hypothetical protein WOLCODRAFT_140890 [Wolfiporia cocos MD-104 SS10]|uniref:F-box domain-containing protein n=1 Tax=Wolfiporia cocos (strain MD-104) TaxID=742152 RepID=A0A2H3JNA7_WOLCO|nr:hypothetical protein WOLCODRAFT_140890 [Wolfiporia cocos MD-104 SS10]
MASSSKRLSSYKMANEIDGQPAAPRIVKRLAFDIKARILRAIKWRPREKPREPFFWREDALLPLFNSETVAFRIPIEIWDKILGCLQDDPETLSATEKVCRAWYPTSRRLRGDCYRNEFHSMEDVRLYARYIKTVPKLRRNTPLLPFTIWGEGKQRGLAHLGTFAAMFAGGQLPDLLSLGIREGEWMPGSIPQSMFLYLSTFHSITRLTLSSITLPSISVLLRLVCAFDRLENLGIGYLRLLDRRVPPANKRWAPSVYLKMLDFNFTTVDWPDHLYMISTCAEPETSSSSEIIPLISTAASCSHPQQLLHHAGKAIRELGITMHCLPPDRDPRSIEPVRVPNLDLSKNVGLKELEIDIVEHNLLMKVEIYDVIQQIISSTSHTALEKILINLDFRHSEAGPSASIMSDVLLALRKAVCHPDHPSVLEKYTSLKEVTLQFYETAESSKRQMEADWDKLAPTWFPGLYSRGMIKLEVRELGQSLYNPFSRDDQT